jgi:hypothetical protein
LTYFGLQGTPRVEAVADYWLHHTRSKHEFMSHNHGKDDEECSEGADEWLDDDAVPLCAGDQVSTFQAGDLIDLDAPELEDNLANVIPTCFLERRAQMPPGSGVGPSDQGTEAYLGHADWGF